MLIKFRAAPKIIQEPITIFISVRANRNYYFCSVNINRFTTRFRNFFFYRKQNNFKFFPTLFFPKSSTLNAPLNTMCPLFLDYKKTHYNYRIRHDKGFPVAFFWMYLVHCEGLFFMISFTFFLINGNSREKNW